jgi:3-hydroxyisobutyrate dehydrogenase
MVVYDCQKNGDLNNIDFRAEGFPDELIDNEIEEKGYEI